MKASEREKERKDSLHISSDNGASVLKKGIEKTPLALTDPLQMYLMETNRYGLLKREEEKELAIRAGEHNDQEAENKLVTSNLRLVVKIAMDFQRYWLNNLLDLIQEGNMGLIQAVKKYDPYRGIKFSYYASFWIRAYILKYIIDNWRLVKIGTTQHQRKLFFKLSKERDRMIAQGEDPQPKLLAERLDVREDEVVEMTERLGNWEISIDAPVGENSRDEYRDILPAHDKGVDEKVAAKQGKTVLLKGIRNFRAGLSGRDADIFDNRIIAEKPETLRQLGDKHGISRERVRQLEMKIVDNARAWLGEEIPNFEEEYAEMAG